MTPNKGEMGMVIGLTGGSGVGKSTVANMMRKRDMAVVDADVVARDVVKKGERALCEIVNVFGAGVLTQDGNLNRRVLADIVFSDEKKLKMLNNITHPRITEVIQTKIKTAPEILVIDAPLLYEAGLDKLCDVVIMVTASYENRLKRIMLRDNIEEDLARKRLYAQKNQQQYFDRANYALENDGDMVKLEKDLDNVLSQIMRRNHSGKEETK